MTIFYHESWIKFLIKIFSVKNGEEIKRIQNERNMDASNEGNRDESNVPGGASGTFGTGAEGADRTKQSTGIEQELTMWQSEAQQQAQQDLPPFPQDASTNQTKGQPEAPFQPNVQSPVRAPSPPRPAALPTRPEIPSMASLNLNERSSTRSQRSSQYSFTSQDAAQSISYELTKTGRCTFHDVASKVRSK